MDFNHIYNNHHTPTKFPINNNNSSTINWVKQGLFNNITMDMEDHHHHQHHHHHHEQHHHHHEQQHHHQQQQQDYNQQVQQHQPLMPLLDPIWQAYHNLPTPHQSQPPTSSSSSSYIMKPNLLQNQVLEQEDDHDELEEEEEEEELGATKEMMYRIAVMQPVDIDPATIRKPKRRNVRISNDPQSVAARHRRERISERIRILQRLVPGGTKMDTASMLDEAIRYVKFLKRQIRQLQSNSTSSNHHHHHHHPPPPPLPVLPASDWPPLPPSAAKGVLIRDNNDDHHSGRMSFQHGGN